MDFFIFEKKKSEMIFTQNHMTPTASVELSTLKNPFWQHKTYKCSCIHHITSMAMSPWQKLYWKEELTKPVQITLAFDQPPQTFTLASLALHAMSATRKVKANNSISFYIQMIVKTNCWNETVIWWWRIINAQNSVVHCITPTR